MDDGGPTNQRLTTGWKIAIVVGVIGALAGGGSARRDSQEAGSRARRAESRARSLESEVRRLKAEVRGLGATVKALRSPQATGAPQAATSTAAADEDGAPEIQEPRDTPLLEDSPR